MAEVQLIVEVETRQPGEEWRVERWRMAEARGVVPEFTQALPPCSFGRTWVKYLDDELLVLDGVYYRRVGTVE